mgnify:CR=1 FL=1
MKIQDITNKFCVKKLKEENIDEILTLCKKNELFYRYHPPMATRESILDDLNALPPNKAMKDKYYLGFYKEEVLVAVLDLILDFPEEKVAYIGFFLMKEEEQGKGIGSEIIRDCMDYLMILGYKKVRLAIDEGNSQRQAFWRKNLFKETGQRVPNDVSTYLPMERIL